MNISTARRVLSASVAMLLLGAGAGSQQAAEPGLLFFLSGSRGLTADFAAGGTPAPNFASDVRIIPDGAKGPGIQCGHTQLLSYRAPGNVYAERGTLAFFWRSREPVSRTAFPIFRIGYADHSSWDMVWLRLDYNGKPGFDAFVTDASLARTRVSHAMPAFPAPGTWVHLAVSWDETRGIRLYVNGQMVAKQDGTAIFFAALDQFGPHSRVISPYQVQSAYNFVRGGDVDELRIYDRMLSDDNVATLARGEAPQSIPPLARTLDAPEWRQEWWFRHGWNRPGDPPPLLDAPAVAIRKVEIHDVYDLKRWWWKGTDGIRETTWPGVFNRSRLAGRNDYFQLPDWDCYSLSGRSVTFSMPDELWNHLEISGAAWGKMSLQSPAPGQQANMEQALFERPRGQERTFHRTSQPVRGQQVRFTNVEQETPIGEFAAYYVHAGREPQGVGKLTYRLTALAEPNQPSVTPLVGFINGRFAPDERATMVALPAGAPRSLRAAQPGPAGRLPVVHILIPADLRDVAGGLGRSTYSYSWMNLPGGLDGIALDLPALKVKPTHGAYFPLNIQAKDPIWPMRNLLDVNVSVKPGEPHTLWLDTRDRILPNDKGLYLTIAGAGAGFGPATLEGAELRLVFKARGDAAPEHVLDRFTQVRDNYAQIVEEQPKSRRLSLYTRFETDITDLLRVDPDHILGRQYWYDYNREQPKPPVAIPNAPEDAPLWASRQVEHLRSVKRFVNWYIDHRQIENGEFGGGLSDDGDLTNWWPGTALMGGTPEKILQSLRREMEAFYDQGMFTNGLSTIQTDELHSYEEGIQVLGQSLLLDYGNPKHLERAMETAAATERLTGVNAAGHRHIRTSYFSGTTIEDQGVWGWAKPQSYFIMQPAMALVEYNGSPRLRKWLLELADGLLAHRKPDGTGYAAVRSTIEFATDQDLPGAGERAWPLLWAAFRWTGDRKYIEPFLDAGPRSLSAISGNALDLMGVRGTWGPQILSSITPQSENLPLRHVAWQVSGDTRFLETLYADEIAAAALREYINTEGSLWIDRVNVPDAELQRARLGG
ncbi:MAG: LamG domain-containing protein, partial [Acidobacteria bacterium]|nr:LamG domain-containing protein [Acidobacteriota bacterium]